MEIEAPSKVTARALLDDHAVHSQDHSIVQTAQAPDHGGDVIVRVFDVVVTGEVIKRRVPSNQAAVANEFCVVAVIGAEVL